MLSLKLGFETLKVTHLGYTLGQQEHRCSSPPQRCSLRPQSETAALRAA